MNPPDGLPSSGELTPPIVGAGAWTGHVPFAYDLIWALQPQRVIELGVDRGESLLAMADAAQHFSPNSKILGIDSWEGDAHAGSSSMHLFESVLSDLDALDFPGVSVRRSLFDAALAEIPDGSIDLLHIDGLHTYEAVWSDWTAARPKLRPDAVILFHDTRVVGGDFGVHRAFEEIRAGRAGLEFPFFFGLGVLRTGGPGSERFEDFWAWLSGVSGDAELHYRTTIEKLKNLPHANRPRIAHTQQVAADFDTCPPQEELAPLSAPRPTRFQRAGNPTLPAYRTSESNKALSKKEAQLFSILIPVFQPDFTWLSEAIASVQAQTESDWECIVIDDGNTADVASQLIQLCDSDAALNYHRNPENLHIAGALNQGLEKSQGRWVLVLDQDDRLYPDALEMLKRTIEAQPEAQIVYSDEEKIDASGSQCFEPFHKPGFQRELLGTQNYFNHITCYRRSLADALGGYRQDRPGCHDWDFLLRAVQALKHKHIAHAPYVLYQWRAHDRSTAQDLDAKPYVLESARRCAEAFWGEAFTVKLDYAGYISLEATREVAPQIERLSLGLLQDLEMLRTTVAATEADFCLFEPTPEAELFFRFASLPEIAYVIPHFIQDGRFLDHAYVNDSEGQLRLMFGDEPGDADGYFHQRRLPISPDLTELWGATFKTERLHQILERMGDSFNQGALYQAMTDLGLRPLMAPIHAEMPVTYSRLPIGNITAKTFSARHPRSPQRMDRPFTGLRSQRHK